MPETRRSRPQPRSSKPAIRARVRKKTPVAGGRRKAGIVPALKLPPPTLEWKGGAGGFVAMIDQTLLPEKYKILRVRDMETLWDSIRRLAVRGAPAIGVAAAYGVVLGLRQSPWATRKRFLQRLAIVKKYLASSRPTAVNLFWALDRMERRAVEIVEAEETAKLAPARRRAILGAILQEACRVHEEDRELCAQIGRHGAKLLRSGWNVLTHCNAGALATGGSGTALSVIYSAVRAGKQVAVYADETRPLLQGARLTAWELGKAGIDVTVICDGAAASVLGSGRVQCVVVGADRIARNGDVANKIGTYGVAVLARENDVPFYVAAPSTTFDLALASGKEIPIEERAADEVLSSRGRRAAAGVAAFNPAFDVTPARYVRGIITEHGVISAPYTKNIRRVLGSATS